MTKKKKIIICISGLVIIALAVTGVLLTLHIKKEKKINDESKVISTQLKDFNKERDNKLGVLKKYLNYKVKYSENKSKYNKNIETMRKYFITFYDDYLNDNSSEKNQDTSKMIDSQINLVKFITKINTEGKYTLTEKSKKEYIDKTNSEIDKITDALKLIKSKLTDEEYVKDFSALINYNQDTDNELYNIYVIQAKILGDDFYTDAISKANSIDGNEKAKRDKFKSIIDEKQIEIAIAVDDEKEAAEQKAKEDAAAKAAAEAKAQKEAQEKANKQTQQSSQTSTPSSGNSSHGTPPAGATQWVEGSGWCDEWSLLVNDPAARKRMIDMMYGGEDPTGKVGSVNDDHSVGTLQ